MSSEKAKQSQSDNSQAGQGSQNNQQPNKKDGQPKKEDKPPGGYDSSRLPHLPPGYTVKVTFHRATHLPMADLHTFSSDPYLTAALSTSLPTRHKEDPGMIFRSHTVWKSTEPEFGDYWIIGNVPADGFKLKVRIYDEDSTDKDDRLGNVHINVGRLDGNFKTIRNQPYDIKKRSGSKRAYFLRAIAVCMQRTKKMSGDLYVSIEVLGKTEGNEGNRTYTIGPNAWCKHRSPLLGRLTNIQDATDTDDEDNDNHNQANDLEEAQTANADQPNFVEKHLPHGKPHNEGHKKPGKYNFQANQMQLRGPIPEELYHRYVEFRPIIGSLFTSKGLRGLILNKGLHMQHNRVYNFNRQTEYGRIEHPGQETSRKFLDLVHYDIGGKIFTYVLTLDALMRFTETGKEFGIDLLSKHTMHSDASIYIAFSGEFFIRRLKHPHRKAPEQEQQEASQGKGKHNDHNAQDEKMHESHKEAEENTQNESHPPQRIEGGPPREEPPHDPAYYEIIIDNDSGTYRPNAQMLPILKKFLESNFEGMKVVTLDCGKDKELMDRLKSEQRATKKAEGSKKKYTQVDDASSLSSEDVDRMQQNAEAEREENEGGSGEAKHKLGEAVAPFLGNHSKARKLVGAPQR